MIQMVCPRHYTLRSKTGHVLRFEPNVPRPVPEDVVQEAMALNILPVDRNDVPDPVLADGLRQKGVVQVQVSALVRDALVYRVLDLIATENDVVNFDGGGRPKTSIIADRVGLALTAAERNTYWDKYRQIKASGEDLPKHKCVDAILEVQYLSTPKQLIEYGALYNVPLTSLEGRTLKEQKTMIVGAILSESHAAKAA